MDLCIGNRVLAEQFRYFAVRARADWGMGERILFFLKEEKTIGERLVVFKMPSLRLCIDAAVNILF